MSTILHYTDFIWLGLIVLIARRSQRRWAIPFAIAMMAMMRMMAEFMDTLGYPYGFLGLLPYSVFSRGLAVYTLGYLVYIGLLQFSPNAQGPVLMAASISIFFACFFVFAFVMCL